MEKETVVGLRHLDDYFGYSATTPASEPRN